MYQIYADNILLYDPRIVEYAVFNPKCTLEANTAGSASFTIYADHPLYNSGHFKRQMRSIFEIRESGTPIFRGRVRSSETDFNNARYCELEGVLGFLNDSIIAPFQFPQDFTNASSDTNKARFLLNWVLDQHNSQVEKWQQLKLGNVDSEFDGVSLSCQNDDYNTAWAVLSDCLVGSDLGGYLIIRYESDGNYVDYLKDFELYNTQTIEFTKNLLDVTQKIDADSTFTAVMPIGPEIETGEESDSDKPKQRYTIESLPDGNLTDNLVKKGKFIYSESAVNQFGWICMPPSDTTWDADDLVEREEDTPLDEATLLQALLEKGIESLGEGNIALTSTLTVKALDLGFTDVQVQSLKVCRYVEVSSPVHGIESTYRPLTKLDIDMANPQNTNITIGGTSNTLSGISVQNKKSIKNKIANTAAQLVEVKTDVAQVRTQSLVQSTQAIADCSEIILSALKSYVETSNFNEYKNTVTSQLAVLASEITLKFSDTYSTITDVNGDLQQRLNEIYKHFAFDLDGITIGAGEDAVKMNLDNDQLVFSKSGVEIVRLDINNFTPTNVYIKAGGRVRLGNFAHDVDEDGGLSFGKVV